MEICDRRLATFEDVMLTHSLPICFTVLRPCAFSLSTVLSPPLVHVLLTAGYALDFHSTRGIEILEELFHQPKWQAVYCNESFQEPE